MNGVKVAGHRLHPMLIVFPLGLLATSLAWDIAYLSSRSIMWAEIAYWSIVAGIIGAILAAVPGFIDWLAIPQRTRARRIGLYHMVMNLVLLALFALSALWRAQAGYENPPLGSLILSWIGVGTGVISGWLGGELVERLGVGVYADANVDAPSSLDDARRRRGEREPGHGAPHPV